MRFFEYVVVLIILALIILPVAFFVSSASELSKSEEVIAEEEITKFVREPKVLEKGNGVVVNIWIDDHRLNNLKFHNVKYLFVDVGDMNRDGKLKNKDDIGNFIEKIGKFEKATGHDFILLPYTELNTKKYDSSNLAFQDNFVAEYAHLRELGFDGIYVDIEPVPFTKRVAYLRFLERLNNDIGDGIVSIYAGHFVWSDTGNVWEWDSEFYSRVSERADLIFAGLYDSFSKSEGEYRYFVSEAIEGIVFADLDSYVMLGLPAHKTGAESFDVAVDEYLKNIETHKIDNLVGVTVFAEWVMNEKDWELFDRL